MSKNLYSIVLPVYNERENLPIVTHILNGIRQKQYHYPHAAGSILRLSS